MALQFEVLKSGDQYYWRLWSKGNWKILGHSERYHNKSDCLAAVSKIKSEASSAEVVDASSQKVG